MNTTWQIPPPELHSAAQRLAKADDDLSRQIADLESAINDLNLRVCAWIEEPVFGEIEYINYDDSKYYCEIHYTRRLGYGEHQGEWGLLVSTDWDETGGDPNVTFLRNSSLDIRLSAVDRLPEILDSLTRKVMLLGDEVLEKAYVVKRLAERVR